MKFWDKTQQGIRMHPLLVALVPVATVFTTHYASSQLYTYLCVPLSFEGFLQSVITTASPVCTGLLGVMTHTSNAYGTAITGGISWVIMNWLGKPQIAQP